MASNPAENQIIQQRPHATAAMEHYFDIRQFFGPLPHGAVAREEELVIHAGRNQRTVLHAQIVAEEDDIDIRSDGAQIFFQIGEVHFHQAVQQAVRAGGSPARSARKLSLRHSIWPRSSRLPPNRPRMARSVEARNARPPPPGPRQAREARARTN